MMETPEEIRKRFLADAEGGYKRFSDMIVVPKDHRVIGIRMPVIKRYAKYICSSDWRSYLTGTEDEYHEDLLLRGFIIAWAGTEPEERFRLIRGFVPKMDNWAVCDSFSMAFKITKRNADAFWDLIIPYLDTDEEFQIRFAVVMMLAHFVDDRVGDVIKHIEKIKHPAYYVKMAVAWCVCDCFVKFPKETMVYLKSNTLDDFTFNKALSKITDSLRVSDDVKNGLRRMRRK
jgi:3-methyladenine DNA glycosylase AlkD